MKFFTYVYYDPSRNEPIYVGKGKDDRYFHHISRTDKHPLTHRLQYMKNHDIEVQIQISRLMSEAEANEKEKCLIASIGRKDQGQGPLLNLTDGGEGSSGYRHTEESRTKMSANSKNKTAEYKANMSAAHKGRKNGPRSAECRAKISENRKLPRVPLSEITKAKLSIKAKLAWEKKKALKEESLNGLLEY